MEGKDGHRYRPSLVCDVTGSGALTGGNPTGGYGYGKVPVTKHNIQS